jgi:formate-nitrite transporter family protein
VAAGISIGFSFLTQGALAAALPASEWRHLIADLGYAVGFIVVILGRQQLFTENVLTAVLPVITRRKLGWLLRMLRLWGVVLAALRLRLRLCVAADCQRCADRPNAHGEHARRNVREGHWRRMAHRVRGVDHRVDHRCGVLRDRAADLPDCAVRLTHIVAGAAEALYGWLAGLASFQDVTLKFFLPTLAGNVFGGTILFSVLSYAQVREEIFEEEHIQAR